MKLLQDKVAIITGAGSGIGRATAQAFVTQGACVALVDAGAAGLEAARAELPADRTALIVADVADESQSARYVDETVRRFGGLDIAVFNVGIAGEIKPIPQSSIEIFDRVMAVNVRGTWLGLRYAIPQIAKRGGGSIVLTASTAGFRAGAPGRSAYVTSKHAVVGLMRAAAAECAPLNIRVNSVSPGGVDTPMTASLKDMFGEERAREMRQAFEKTIPLKRIAEPAEIADTIVFFASDQSRYCTATNLMVDGGLMG
jgi:3alpha(or 20beta)-hydroxysteroid dehydrogenase